MLRSRHKTVPFIMQAMYNLELLVAKQNKKVEFPIQKWQEQFTVVQRCM